MAVHASPTIIVLKIFKNKKTPAENSEGLVNNRKGCVILIRRQLQPLKRGLYRLRLWRRGRGQQIQ